jgi:hypothetical protein
MNVDDSEQLWQELKYFKRTLHERKGRQYKPQSITDIIEFVSKEIEQNNQFTIIDKNQLNSTPFSDFLVHIHGTNCIQKGCNNRTGHKFQFQFTSILFKAFLEHIPIYL